MSTILLNNAAPPAADPLDNIGSGRSDRLASRLTVAPKEDVADALDDSLVPVRMWLGLLVGIAVALRVLVLVLGPMGDVDRAFAADSAAYLTLAHNLAEHGVFGTAGEAGDPLRAAVEAVRSTRGETEPVGPSGLKPEVLLTPGYPAFLALFQLAALPLTVVLAVQCLLGAAAVALTYVLAQQVLGRRRPAVFAAGLIALHPTAVAASNLLVCESLLVVLLLAALWGATHKGESLTLACLLGGLALGAAMLVRPLPLVLIPALALWPVLTARQPKAAIAGAVFLMAATGPVAAWSYRNTTLDLPAVLSPKGDLDRALLVAPMVATVDEDGVGARPDVTLASATAALEALPLAPAAPAKAGVGRPAASAPAETGEATLFAAATARVREARTASPMDWLAVMRVEAVRSMADHGLDRVWAELGFAYAPVGLAEKLVRGDGSGLGDVDADPVGVGLSTAWILFNAVLMIGTAAGMVALVVRRRWGAAVLLALLIATFASADVWVGDEQLRSMLVMLQAVAVVGFAAAPGPERKAKRRKKPQEDVFDLGDPAAEEPGPVQREGMAARPI